MKLPQATLIGLFASAFAISAIATASAQSASVKANGATSPIQVAPGATITITATGGTNHIHDWIALSPVGAANNSYVDWWWMNGTRSAPATPLTSASFTSQVPSTPGTYELRFWDYAWNRLATSATITVAQPVSVKANGATSPIQVAPGATITITATGGTNHIHDWIAFSLVGAAPNSYVDWWWMNGTRTAPATPLTSASFTAQVPSTPGTYELRFFDYAWNRLATSATIIVASVKANGATTPIQVAQGSTMTITAIGGTNHIHDWIALSPVGAANNSYVDWWWMNGTRTAPTTPLTSAAFTAQAPSTPGTYELRFWDPYWNRRATSATITVLSAAPTMTPASGVYTSAQTVTITAAAMAPPSTIRYTLDGSTPAATSTIYGAPLTVSTAMTVNARSFPNDGSAGSATATSTLTFNYGTLAPPGASPAGGVFAAAPQVTLTSIAGATIRYTLNGATPTASSPLYTGAIPIPAAGATLKSIALHPDWTESPVSAPAYTIDIAPPTIVAKRFPLPMGNWQLTPVTVSFVCSDNVGIATCSSPSLVSLEGAGQTVSGAAVDHVGREATVQETVNVDLTPPVVTVTAPADGLVTANSTVVVSAEVGDALSGLGVVNCNGVATAVVDGVVTCTTTLRPGRNAITVSARDVAGHSSSAGATVTLAGTPTRLTLSPAARTMLVDEVATLSLRDDFGVPAPAATWVSSDPSVVSLSPDDPPVLTALTTGSATITATKNGLSDVSTITVVAGAGLPEGTTQWTVAPTPGGGSSWFEAPIYTNRTDETGPDLFMVETNTTTWERRLRAMSSSGEVAWLAASPGVPLMGDMFGGVIAGVEPSPNHCMGPFNEIQRCYIALARSAGPTGTTSWRYDSPGLVDRPAQGPDGTLYVVEHLGDHLYEPNNNGNAYFPYPGEKALVILNGATGAVTARVPLEGDPNREPVTVGPIVGADGSGYLLVAKGMEVALRRFSRDGPIASTVIVPATCSGSQCRPPVPGQLLPDGLGGLLMTADWANASQLTTDLRLTRFDSDGDRTDTMLAWDTGTIELIGQGGTAYLRKTSGTATVGQPVMDLLTWTPRWHLPVEWSSLSATPDGGAVAQNAAGDIAHFDGTGQLLRTIPATGLRNPVQEFGAWFGNSNEGFRSVVGTADDATRWDETYKSVLWSGEERNGFGGRQRNLAQRNPGIGLFAKAHPVLFPMFHMSVRIVPTRQQYWADRLGTLMANTDTYGNHFFTLGAGPGTSDAAFCSGLLTSDRNRDNDVNNFPWRLEKLQYAPVLEDSLIDDLIIGDFLFPDGTLPYACFPENDPGYYNSNSYVIGILRAVNIPDPAIPYQFPSLFPGSRRPVPAQYFQPQ